MLGVTRGSDLSLNDHILTTAKAAACKLGLLFRSRRYFTPSSLLLTLYKAQIRPCLEYGSHLWRGASKHSLATLDAIQKRAIKLLGDPALTNSLDSLAPRRTISALSLYYRYDHGVKSQKIVYFKNYYNSNLMNEAVSLILKVPHNLSRTRIY